MSDQAALREARRRKILNNSENRLKYISGHESNLEKKDDPIDEKTAEPDLIEFLSEDVVNDVPYEIFPDPEIETLSSLPPQQRQDVKYPQKTPNFLVYKLDLLLLSLFIQILYNFSFLSKDMNLMLPLIIFSLTKFFVVPIKSEGGIASALLVMNGIPQQNAEKILRALKLVQYIVEDSFVFMFFTIFIQALFFLNS